MHLPERYTHREEARRRHGATADRYAGTMMATDPLADAVVALDDELGSQRARAMLERALKLGIGEVPDAPDALRALFAQVDEVPRWVDRRALDLGASTYQRLGAAGPLILSAWGLMNGYHSGPAVKPLAFTKQLDAKAPRRLAETGRFVIETAQVGGMARFAPGFQIAVRVRVLHAMVRRMLERSGRWDAQSWGAPINQADMLGTVIEFSLLVLAGARMMGFRFTEAESEAVIHLWRYSGHVSGVDPWLLEQLESEARGVAFAEMIKLIQAGPDEDSVALAAALRRVPLALAETPFEKRISPYLVKVHDGLTRAFNGDEIADALHIPNPAWRHVIYPTRALVGGFETLRRLLPYGSQMASRVGNRKVKADIAKMLGGVEPRFAPVRRLTERLRSEAGALVAA